MDSCAAWHLDTGTVGAAPRVAVRPLAQLRPGQRGWVDCVIDGDVAATDGGGSTMQRRLIEIGFVPGERVEVVDAVRPGGDPMAVRIGNSMFALRRREAQAVLVQLEDA